MMGVGRSIRFAIALLGGGMLVGGAGPAPAAGAEGASSAEVGPSAPITVPAAPFIPNDRGEIGNPRGWQYDQWSFLATAGGIDAPAAWASLGAPGTEPGRGVTV